MKTLVSDVRYALRLLLRSRGFMTAPVLTLALGIGANAAFFSLADATLLGPLDFRDAHTLIPVVPSSAYLDYQEYRDRADLFSGASATGRGNRRRESTPRRWSVAVGLDRFCDPAHLDPIVALKQD